MKQQRMVFEALNEASKQGSPGQICVGHLLEE